MMASKSLDLRTYSRMHLWLTLRVVMSTLPRLRTILLNRRFLTIENISDSAVVLIIIFSSSLRVQVAISFCRYQKGYFFHEQQQLQAFGYPSLIQVDSGTGVFVEEDETVEAG